MFCCVNDWWLSDVVDESHDLARRFGLLNMRRLFIVLARLCLRNSGQDGSCCWCWWNELVDGSGISLNDSHLHEAQRGHKGTGICSRPCNNGSHQFRSVRVKSKSSFDTILNILASMLLIDTARRVDWLLAALQPKNSYT